MFRLYPSPTVPLDDTPSLPLLGWVHTLGLETGPCLPETTQTPKVRGRKRRNTSGLGKRDLDSRHWTWVKNLICLSRKDTEALELKSSPEAPSVRQGRSTGVGFVATVHSTFTSPEGRRPGGVRTVSDCKGRPTSLLRSGVTVWIGIGTTRPARDICGGSFRPWCHPGRRRTDHVGSEGCGSVARVRSRLKLSMSLRGPGFTLSTFSLEGSPYAHGGSLTHSERIKKVVRQSLNRLSLRVFRLSLTD